MLAQWEPMAVVAVHSKRRALEFYRQATQVILFARYTSISSHSHILDTPPRRKLFTPRIPMLQIVMVQQQATVRKHRPYRKASPLQPTAAQLSCAILPNWALETWFSVCQQPFLVYGSSDELLRLSFAIANDTIPPS